MLTHQWSEILMYLSLIFFCATVIAWVWTR